MNKMHENELEISESLVRNLLNRQCPQWAYLNLKPIESSGTDNALFRLGNDYVVRLPRIDWATKGIEKEYEWVPKIARFLKTAISEPISKGHPDETYPWSWMIIKWNEGYNPSYENDHEYELLALDLAVFLNEFHKINLLDGPPSRRGISLEKLDNETTKAIPQLEDELDIKSITALWHYFSNLPKWSKAPVWVHGDFLPGNILIENNRLNAVIDFSDVGIGDPACDLVIAWSLLTPQSRKLFKMNLENIDHDTWERGRGWALSIALIMLPYYKNTNPALTALARQIISNVINE